MFPVASLPVAASLSCRFFLWMMWMCLCSFGLLVGTNKHAEGVTLGSLWRHFSPFSEFWQSKQSTGWWRNESKWAPARPTPDYTLYAKMFTGGTLPVPEYFVVQYKYSNCLNLNTFCSSAWRWCCLFFGSHDVSLLLLCWKSSLLLCFETDDLLMTTTTMMMMSTVMMILLCLLQQSSHCYETQISFCQTSSWRFLSLKENCSSFDGTTDVSKQPV